MVLRPPGSANISLTRVAHSNPDRHPPSRPPHTPTQQTPNARNPQPRLDKRLSISGTRRIGTPAKASGRQLRNAREASARHGACAAPTRRGLPTSAIRSGERPAEVAWIVEAIVSVGRRWRSLPWQRHSESGPAARAEAVVAPPGTNRPGCARSRQGTEFAESRFRASRVTFVRRQRPYRRSSRSRSSGCCSARAKRSSHRCRDKRCSVSSLCLADFRCQ